MEVNCNIYVWSLLVIESLSNNEGSLSMFYTRLLLIASKLMVDWIRTHRDQMLLTKNDELSVNTPRVSNRAIWLSRWSFTFLLRQYKYNLSVEEMEMQHISIGINSDNRGWAYFALIVTNMEPNPFCTMEWRTHGSNGRSYLFNPMDPILVTCFAVKAWLWVTDFFYMQKICFNLIGKKHRN